MVGLSNCDNTSDINKPVSTAQAAAILVNTTDISNNSASIATLNSEFSSLTAGQYIVNGYDIRDELHGYNLVSFTYCAINSLYS